jgi:hypothetical protein
VKVSFNVCGENYRMGGETIKFNRRIKWRVSYSVTAKQSLWDGLGALRYFGLSQVENAAGGEMAEV